jgi:hypothetical protein
MRWSLMFRPWRRRDHSLSAHRLANEAQGEMGNDTNVAWPNIFLSASRRENRTAACPLDTCSASASRSLPPSRRRAIRAWPSTVVKSVADRSRRTRASCAAQTCRSAGTRGNAHHDRALHVQPWPLSRFQLSETRCRRTALAHDAQCRFGAAKWGIESGGIIVAERPHRKPAEKSPAELCSRLSNFRAKAARPVSSGRQTRYQYTRVTHGTHDSPVPCRQRRAAATGVEDVHLLRLASCGKAYARSVGARSMLNTSVSESGRRSFPVDARPRWLEGGHGFLVVDSANPRHLWGSDERILSVSYEGSAISSEFVGFFYFLGQA